LDLLEGGRRSVLPEVRHTRWVCENHFDWPFWANGPAVAAALAHLCPACNKVDATDPDDVPAMRAGFKPDLS
jgi:hypothetical protein